MPETQTRSYRRLTDEDIARAKKLISEGMTVKVVSDNLGVSTATIYKLTRNGNEQKAAKQPKVKQSSEDTLVAKVRSTFDKLEAKVKFHQAKAAWYESQINALKGVLSN